MITVDPKEFEMGLKEEKEHNKTVDYDPKTIEKIVLDHLAEDPHYYTKLKTVMKAGIMDKPSGKGFVPHDVDPGGEGTLPKKDSPADIPRKERPGWQKDLDNKASVQFDASDESGEIMGLFQFLQYMKLMNLGFPETPKHLKAMQCRHKIYHFASGLKK